MAKQSVVFAITFVALFALAFMFLAVVDALPEPLIQNQTNTNIGTSDVPRTSDVQTPELPIRVVAPSIGMDNNVQNPESNDINVLDAALLKGAVRYPDSALLGTSGTVLIFGHSSYLPIVHNQNYKAFNGIQKLKVGATVSVYSATSEYRYTVTNVYLANATEDTVELSATGKFLTLVTCDSFGTKSDRFVVTAEFAGVYAVLYP